ncbi:MAG TPA: diguanylate cyclase [Fimbriimonas sp.]|nr:diguanylate cyclase [Fimbriimonas sp.]
MTERQQQALADAKLALDISNRSPKKALELAHKALEFDNSGAGLIQAYALAAYGSAYVSLGLYEEAQRYIHQAQSCAFENRLTHVMARIHQARGWLSLSQGDPVTAFSDWQIAFDYFQQVRDLRGTAWILYHYADNYSTLGLEDHAIRCKVSALELAESLDEAEQRAELQVSTAQSYLARAWNASFASRHAESTSDAIRATAISLSALERPELLSPRWLEAAHHALGESLMLHDRCVEAIPNLSFALEGASKNGQFTTESRIKGAIGYAQWKLGEPDTARAMLQEAILGLQADAPLADALALNTWLATVEQGSGNDQRAAELLWQALETKGKIHEQNLKFWALFHDHTLGLGNALRAAEWVADQEQQWSLDLAKLSMHQAGLSIARVTDPLTGLINRSAFDREDLQRGYIVSVIGIEAVNAQYGRGAGDEVLRSAASILSASVLDGCLVARWSGDSFAVASDNLSQNVIEAAFQRYPWKSICPGIRLSLKFEPLVRQSNAA